MLAVWQAPVRAEHCRPLARAVLEPQLLQRSRLYEIPPLPSTRMVRGRTRSGLSGPLMTLWTYVFAAARERPGPATEAVAASDPLTARATREIASVVRVTGRNRTCAASSLDACCRSNAARGVEWRAAVRARPGHCESSASGRAAKSARVMFSAVARRRTGRPYGFLAPIVKVREPGWVK